MCNKKIHLPAFPSLNAKESPAKSDAAGSVSLIYLSVCPLIWFLVLTCSSWQALPG